MALQLLIPFVNTYVIDNNSTNTGGFNLTGTWSQQNVSNAYNTTNSYLTSPAYAGNTATWTFANLPAAPVCDTDGDGVPNIRDLDSDGDGCFDAVEAKTVSSLTQSIVSSPYGNNGFANSIETNSESGVYTGTYVYSRATDASIRSCLDTDFDGVPDLDDLDDDNDGILDVSECNTYPKNILFAGSAEDFNGIRSNLFTEFDTYKKNGAVITQSNIIENATVPSGFYDGYDMVIFGGAAINTIHQNHWNALKNAIINKTSKSFIIQSDNCCNLTNKNNLISLLNAVHGTSYTLNATKPVGDELLAKNNANSYSTAYTSSSLTGSDYYGVFGVASSDGLFFSINNSSLAYAGMKQLPNTQEKNREI